MKRLLILVVLILTTTFQVYSQKRPSWVEGVPYNEMNYTGIASASKSENNYQDVATQRAFRSLAAQIKVTVSSESLLTTIEKNGVVTSDFEESINISADEQIEGCHLVESWQDDSQYWVYYELNRFDYEDYVKARRERAIRSALDFWEKGKGLLSSGNIQGATTMFANGLDILVPVMHEDLRCNYKGSTINIASEIYNSMITLWSDVVLVANPSSLEVELLKGAAQSVAIGCYKNRVALSNIALAAKFTSGDGVISSIAPTNASGVSALSITSITSKTPSQQVEISVVADRVDNYSKVCQAILSSFKFPKTNLTLTLGESRLAAYIEEENMAIESLSNTLSSMISNGYFDVTTDVNSADLVIKLSSTFASGREVAGDLYNTREYEGSLVMDVIDNRTQRSVVRYNVDRTTALLPLDRTASQGKQSVAREVLKRANRELPRILSQIRVDTSTPIPPRAAAPQEQTPPAIEPTLPSAPAPEPTPEPAPAPVPTPTPAQEIKGQLEQDIWIVYNGLTHINNTSVIEMTIVNNRDSEYSFNKFVESQFKVFNQKGEATKVKTVKVGSNSNGYRIVSTIVAGVPTKMLITIDRLESIALLQIGDLKMRGLK